MKKSRIKKIPLSRPYFDADELEEVRTALDSGWVAQGPKVKELEERIARFLKVSHVIAVTNCTAALHLALLSLSIKEKDEVLVADYTFPATGHAVLYCGAKPVFVDIDPKTYNIDPLLIEKKITKRTKAIIPVHTFGQPADMGSIMKIARRRGLKVIEDAACAFGAKYRDRFAGTISDIGCFSFHARKGITTGEGGIVVTDKKHIAQRIRSLSGLGAARAGGSAPEKGEFSIPQFSILGYNYKMSDITASLGIAQLRKIDRAVRKRQILARYWGEKLKIMRYITPPYVSKNVLHVYQSYVALIDKRINRNRLIQLLAKKGVQTQIGTYASCAQPVYRSREQCPSSLDIFNRSLALPMYYSLKKKEIDNAANIIKRTLEEIA